MNLSHSDKTWKFENIIFLDHLRYIEPYIGIQHISYWHNMRHRTRCRPKSGPLAGGTGIENCHRIRSFERLVSSEVLRITVSGLFWISWCPFLDDFPIFSHYKLCFFSKPCLITAERSIFRSSIQSEVVQAARRTLGVSLEVGDCHGDAEKGYGLPRKMT